MRQRIEWIDIVKGICIILVVISHISGIPLIGKYLFAPYVTVFYYLSGMVYRKKNHTLFQRSYRRSKKLLGSYIKYGIIVTMILCIIELFHGTLTSKSFFNFLVGLVYSRHSIYIDGVPLLTDVNSTFWFITSLVTSSIYFELLLAWENKLNKYILILGSLFISICMSRIPILLPWSIDTAPFGGLLMYLGYKTNINKISKNIVVFESCTILRILMLLMSYIVLCEVNSESNFSVRNYGKLPFGWNCIVFFIITIIGIYLYILMARFIESHRIISKILMYIGRNTLQILCLHLLLIRIYYDILSFWSISLKGIVYWISVVICLFVSIVIPLLYGEIEQLCKEKANGSLNVISSKK